MASAFSFLSDGKQVNPDGLFDPSAATASPAKPKQRPCVFVLAITSRVHDSETPSGLDFKSLITRACSPYEVRDYVFQLEAGTKNGHKHFQGYIKLGKKTRASTVKNRFLSLTSKNDSYLGFHVAPASTAGKDALRSYCLKDDTRLAGPWGFRKIYTGTDVSCVSSSPFPWQRQLSALIASKPDSRTIMWITNSGGNVGKSAFTKHHAFSSPKTVALIPLGTAAQIKTACIAIGPRKTYFVDFPRSLGTGSERISEIFSAIESIKNGWVTSPMYGKYQSLFFDPPHVICFSNDDPPMELLSADRWHVAHLTSKTDTLCSKCQSGTCPHAGHPMRALRKRFPLAFPN